MACNEVLPLMHNYFDGDLEAADRRFLKDHLSICKSCSQEFKQLERSEAMFRASLSVSLPVSEELTDRIMNSLPPVRKPNSFFRWIRRHPAAFVAAVFIILMFGSLVTLWDEGNELMVKGSGMDQVLIQGNTVIVPEGQVIHGDLVVKGGKIQIDGEVLGNVIVIDGTLNMASTANISGKISQVNQAVDWIWFKMNELLGLFSK